MMLVFSINQDFNISKQKRIKLAIVWVILTILFCYTILFIGFLVVGNETSNNFLVIELYTYLPGLMALLFILYFKTGTISSKPFQYPGFHWLAFGFYYTLLILTLTIITGFLIGEFQFNPNYTPFSDDFFIDSTLNPIIDIIIYLPSVGILLLFSPGGFIRVLGEEFGWRGYLLPQLLKTRPTLSILISIWLVGFVWFIYHIPFFTVFAPIDNLDQRIYLLLGSAGVFFGANITMVWAYLKTKSLWPALSLHYIWNLTSPIFTGNLYSSANSLGLLNTSSDTLWLVNGEGLIGGVFHFLIGLIFFVIIIKNKDKLLADYQILEHEEDSINSVNLKINTRRSKTNALKTVKRHNRSSKRRRKK